LLINKYPSYLTLNSCFVLALLLSSFKHGGILIETKGGNSQANKI
jgi:hypothetical protein